MPTTLRIAVVLAVLAIGAPALPARAEPLAVMVAVKGKVSVTPAKGGKLVLAGLGQRLERGDRVQVGAGGAVTLFFSDGNVIELGEKSTVTVSGKVTAAAVPKTSVPTDVFAKVTRFVASDASASGLMAVAPMRGAEGSTTLALAPRNTQVMNGRPAFRWRAIDGATRYHVVVTGDAGDAWSRDVAATSLDYPADQPALASGAEYLWTVEAWSDAGPLGKDESPFSVMSEAEAKRVTADLEGIERATFEATTQAAARYLAGSYLMGRGLYGDATEQFEALVQITPDSPGPHQALGTVYRTIGLTDLAAAEFKRAQELSHKP